MDTKKYKIFSGDLDCELEAETYRHAILEAIKTEEPGSLGQLIQVGWEGSDTPYYVETVKFLQSEGLWE